MGKVPKKLSSSSATTAAAESNSESHYTRESVSKAEVSPWKFPTISRQGLKVYVGFGILALGLSATVAVVILRQRIRRRRLKRREDYYNFTEPKSEIGSIATTETENVFESNSALQGERHCERWETSRRPRDIPGLEIALEPEDAPCEQCSYADEGGSRQEDRRIKRWSSFLTYLILMFVVLVVVWRNQHYFVRKNETTGEEGEPV